VARGGTAGARRGRRRQDGIGVGLGVGLSRIDVGVGVVVPLVFAVFPRSPCRTVTARRPRRHPRQGLKVLPATETPRSEVGAATKVPPGRAVVAARGDGEAPAGRERGEALHRRRFAMRHVTSAAPKSKIRRCPTEVLAQSRPRLIGHRVGPRGAQIGHIDPHAVDAADRGHASGARLAPCQSDVGRAPKAPRVNQEGPLERRTTVISRAPRKRRGPERKRALSCPKLDDAEGWAKRSWGDNGASVAVNRRIKQASLTRVTHD